MLDPGIIATIDNCATVCPTIWGWAGAK